MRVWIVYIDDSSEIGQSPHGTSAMCSLRITVFQKNSGVLRCRWSVSKIEYMVGSPRASGDTFRGAKNQWIADVPMFFHGKIKIKDANYYV